MCERLLFKAANIQDEIRRKANELHPLHEDMRRLEKELAVLKANYESETLKINSLLQRLKDQKLREIFPEEELAVAGIEVQVLKENDRLFSLEQERSGGESVVECNICIIGEVNVGKIPR